MKRTIAILTLFLALTPSDIFAQTTLKEYKIGHVVSVSLPDYMNRTIGINDSSIL